MYCDLNEEDMSRVNILTRIVTPVYYSLMQIESNAWHYIWQGMSIYLMKELYFEYYDILLKLIVKRKVRRTLNLQYLYFWIFFLFAHYGSW